MIGLDASLHSVMLQSWFLHTLDFLILPSPIHVPLVIGMILALVMFLAITYSGQIVQNRTMCCDMELHPANRLDPEGLTIGPLMEGIQISKVPAGLLPPGSGLRDLGCLIHTPQIMDAVLIFAGLLTAKHSRRTDTRQALALLAFHLAI
ncbi:hypothetical protein VNO77_22638 [Canavalia gladiata]|uniref:Uncharacterized protein n=1 Tax=Canavalia gladiata TaxID=3824 RepID=A0AAN9L3F7_CANGL